MLQTFKKIGLLIPAITLLFSAGCSSDEPNNENGGQEIPEDELIPFTRFKLTEEEKVIADKVNDFGISFLADMAKLRVNGGERKNFAVSPLSAAMCLSMLATTANEEQRAPILELLDIEDLDALNAYNSMLIERLPFYNEHGVLTLFNNVWYHNIYSLDSQYAEAVRNIYRANTIPLDFKDKGRTIDAINQWASDRTHGRINQIVSDINEYNKIVLANALFYRCSWEEKFDKSLTKNEEFNGYTRKSMVPMMRHDEHKLMGYSSYKDCQLVWNYFKEYNSYFVAILPPEGDDIFEFASNFTPDLYKGLRAYMKASMVDLRMPRFKDDVEISLSEYMDLKNITNYYDFSTIGLGEEKVPLSLTHHTSIEINEEGAVVAAVTNSDGYPSPYYPFVEVTLNRPFVYFIMDNNTKSIYIAGIVADLEGETK